MKTRLYAELADWWPLMTDPADYAESAHHYARLLRLACRPERVLELGSGGGTNASHLKERFHMTLVDVAPPMLAVSQVLNPECTHVAGDMRSIRLGSCFDAVFVEDALSYLTTADDLSRAIETAFVHCRRGGAALLAPDHFRETYRQHTATGGRDEGERSLRYFEWSYDPDPTDTTIETDFVFLLRSGSDRPRAVHDHHTLGLFARDTWLELCRKVGFEPEIHFVESTYAGLHQREVIAAKKPR